MICGSAYLTQSRIEAATHKSTIPEGEKDLWNTSLAVQLNVNSSLQPLKIVGTIPTGCCVDNTLLSPFFRRFDLCPGEIYIHINHIGLGSEIIY